MNTRTGSLGVFAFGFLVYPLAMPIAAQADDAEVLPNGVGRASLDTRFFPPVDQRFDENGNVDLGLYFRKDSWVMALAYDYYKMGNRPALFNRVAKAKRWGVTHNVPVICNEFGAYARTARVEDRIRYYKDIVSVFQELQIPWQTWYPVMDVLKQTSPQAEVFAPKPSPWKTEPSSSARIAFITSSGREC